MFKIDNKGSCDITNLQCSLCCGNGVSGSGIYHGTGFFGPGFANAGTIAPATMSVNNAISLLRQPNTYYPTQLGLGLGSSGPHETAIILGEHNGDTLNSAQGTIEMTEKYTDAIFRLRPVEFKYKSNDKVGIGFTAEEMNDIIPEIVIKNAISDEIESIDYQYLVAPLIKIIQQQQDELNRIKSYLGI